jgi:hypothetical protein
LEIKSNQKLKDIVDVEYDLVIQLQQVFENKGLKEKPSFFNEYFELSLLERDVFDLFSDFKYIYHNKIHENFSQHVIESSEVKDIDSYSIPVRIALLSFLMGEQVHTFCKSGKDRTGMMIEHCQEFVELHSQYGLYPRVREEKKKYDLHRKDIQTSLSMNSSTLEITKMNCGGNFFYLF